MMMRSCNTLFFLLFFSISSLIGQNSTENRPKIGLCLSGGAAKGIAHIALLKKIDSLGIKVDYITGTSMGAIVGGLYAIGYSGQEIEDIAKNADWDLLLSNQTFLSDIHINEKGEYGRYLAEMPFDKWKIILPSGINEGQNLMNELRKLTYRVAHIRDFNQFPIPFKCMAADIVSGEPIVLEKGDLAMALRASMSIPTVFTPVDWGGDSLMVDGGIVHNFPVDILRGMGADFVIGSYTGSRLLSKNQLNSMFRLLYQSTSLQSNTQSESQMKLCDILLNMDEGLRIANLKSADFNKNKRIIAVGDSVVKHALPDLENLAQAQKKYQNPTQFASNDSDLAQKGGFSTITNKPATMLEPVFFIDHILFTGIDAYKQDAALQYLGFHDCRFLTRTEIQEGINRLYSSNLYKQIYFELIGEMTKAQLVIHVSEKIPNQVKFGLHYDNELGSGIVVNATLRDWLGKNSRLIMASDIAESPKLRVHYRQQFPKSTWSYNLWQVYESTKEPFSFQNQQLENYKRHQNQMSAFLSTPLSASAEMGGGILWNRVAYRPIFRITDKNFIGDSRPDSISQLENNRTSTLSAYIFYRKNTFKNTFFPEKGYSFSFQTKYGFLNKVFQEIKTYYGQNINGRQIIDTSIGAFIRPMVSFEAIVPLSAKASFSTKFHAGALLGDKYAESTNLYGENFLLGGTEQRRSPNYFPFAGNHEGFSQLTSFATAQLGLQFQPINNLFIMPHSSFLIGNDKQTAWSSGITVGYRSSVIPILFSIAKATNTNTWQPYFAIGYRF